MQLELLSFYYYYDAAAPVPPVVVVLFHGSFHTHFNGFNLVVVNRKQCDMQVTLETSGCRQTFYGVV